MCYAVPKGFLALVPWVEQVGKRGIRGAGVATALEGVRTLGL